MTSSRAKKADALQEFVADYLLYLLAAASEVASAAFHAKVRAHGLRVPEWRVLASLHDEDGAMVTRLAQLALVEQSRLTKIVDQMAARGLVERRGDRDDRRRVRVWITPEGMRLSKDLIAEARAHEAELLAGLEGSDGVRIKPALRSLIESVDRED